MAEYSDDSDYERKKRKKKKVKEEAESGDYLEFQMSSNVRV